MWHCSASTLALVGLSVAFGGCKRIEEPASDRQSPPSTANADAPVRSASDTTTAGAGAGAGAAGPSPVLAPTELLTLPSSAYQAAIFADEEAIELLTSSAAYRLLPGKKSQQRALDLGFGATVTRESYVYWSEGAIWRELRRAPKPGGATKLAALAEQPQRFVADIAGIEFVFLARSGDEHYSIAKLENGRVKKLYTSPGSIDALTMIGDAVYFVERPRMADWRIARVKLSGGAATFSAAKSGRWPAALSGRKDVIYYDGNRRDVLSLSPDLQEERTLAKDFICSPLAAGASVYCSTMEGVFELLAAEKPRRIVAAPRHLITSLAVTAERLAWISDVGRQGQDRLAVNSVPLGASSAGEGPR